LIRSRTSCSQCCFDRNLLSHKVNLFDLHHKYADVMKLADIVTHLDKSDTRKKRQAGEQ
jgi:maleamate amidohydrolase